MNFYVYNGASSGNPEDIRWIYPAPFFNILFDL
jgi:hypothetical protein